MATRFPPRPPSSTAADHRDEDEDPLDSLRTTSLFTSLSKLCLSEKYSDMEIVCGGETFHAHRAVVCAQSPFFDRALSGGFYETTTRVVELPEDDPEILRYFLQFLYTGNYDDGFTPCADKPSAAAGLEPKKVAERLSNPPGAPLGDESTVKYTNPGANNDAGSRSSHSRDGDFESAESGGEPVEEYNQFADDDSALLSPDTPASHPAESDANDAVPAAKLEDYFSKSRGLLLTHARVYTMAHIYDVPSLRLLARDRFYRAAQPCNLTEDSFPLAVDEVYSQTPDTEVAMREVICRLTANRILSEADFRARMEPVMRKHGEFAVGVLNYVILLGGEWLTVASPW